MALTLLIIPTHALADSIPTWIKNNAKWWSEGQIGDQDFVKGIQYLIQQGIIQVPQTQTNSTSAHEIPGWLKNTAGWWADGQVDDTQFISTLQWLITHNIIIISQPVVAQTSQASTVNNEIISVLDSCMKATSADDIKTCSSFAVKEIEFCSKVPAGDVPACNDPRLLQLAKGTTSLDATNNTTTPPTTQYYQGKKVYQTNEPIIIGPLTHAISNILYIASPSAAQQEGNLFYSLEVEVFVKNDGADAVPINETNFSVITSTGKQLPSPKVFLVPSCGDEHKDVVQGDFEYYDCGLSYNTKTKTMFYQGETIDYGIYNGHQLPPFLTKVPPNSEVRAVVSFGGLVDGSNIMEITDNLNIDHEFVSVEKSFK